VVVQDGESLLEYRSESESVTMRIHLPLPAKVTKQLVLRDLETLILVSNGSLLLLASFYSIRDCIAEKKVSEIDLPKITGKEGIELTTQQE
jgi:hypothetical protein